MARRKQEVALQAEIETQEDWEEMLAKEGLTVVDIYQEWSGPCKAMLSNFKRLKNELGDDNLRFSIAKADTVDALESYRGKCQPCFVCFAVMVGSFFLKRKCPNGRSTSLEEIPNFHFFHYRVEFYKDQPVDSVANGMSILILKQEGKADTVDCLEKYRYTCHPCFLFYAGGVLVAVVRGCNSPLLLKTITEQLAYEHKVLDGNAERKEIRDPLLASMSPKDKSEDEEDEEEVEDDEEDTPSGEPRPRSKSPRKQSAADKKRQETRKGVTMAIIKPDVVADGKVDEVLEKLKESGIEVLEHIERTMSDEEAREFYKHRKDEEYFEGLVQFMTGGPSHFLVLTKGDTGEGIIEEWRELLGPPSVEEAKEQAPESFRAKYGKENYVNALHGSDSQDTATKELAFFFPDFVVPTVPGSGKPAKKAGETKVERTLALIRPDAMAEKKDEIIAKIHEAGFTIAMTKEIQLTEEQAKEFYKEHEGQDYFEELTQRMCSGPMLALALARDDAVKGWRDMLGPKLVDEAKEKAPESLRAQYSVEGVPINTLHGSDSAQTAEKELDYFFPMQQTVAVIKPDAYQTKEEIMEKIKEAGFHIAARKETELSTEVAEAFYGDHKDKEYYTDLVEHMTSGPTLFMVLSKEDAVEGWRSIIGPTDPEQAKESKPDSLRAKYGKTLRDNAVHGSSNVEQAEKSIKLVFGDVEFNADGTLKTTDSSEGEESKEEGQETAQEQAEGSETGSKPASESGSRTGSRTGSQDQQGEEGLEENEKAVGSRPGSAYSEDGFEEDENQDQEKTEQEGDSNEVIEEEGEKQQQQQPDNEIRERESVDGDTGSQNLAPEDGVGAGDSVSQQGSEQAPEESAEPSSPKDVTAVKPAAKTFSKSSKTLSPGQAGSRRGSNTSGTKSTSSRGSVKRTGKVSQPSPARSKASTVKPSPAHSVTSKKSTTSTASKRSNPPPVAKNKNASTPKSSPTNSQQKANGTLDIDETYSTKSSSSKDTLDRLLDEEAEGKKDDSAAGADDGMNYSDDNDNLGDDDCGDTDIVEDDQQMQKELSHISEGGEKATNQAAEHDSEEYDEFIEVVRDQHYLMVAAPSRDGSLARASERPKSSSPRSAHSRSSLRGQSQHSLHDSVQPNHSILGSPKSVKSHSSLHDSPSPDLSIGLMQDSPKSSHSKSSSQSANRLYYSNYSKGDIPAESRLLKSPTLSLSSINSQNLTQRKIDNLYLNDSTKSGRFPSRAISTISERSVQSSLKSPTGESIQSDSKSAKCYDSSQTGNNLRLMTKTPSCESLGYEVEKAESKESLVSLSKSPSSESLTSLAQSAGRESLVNISLNKSVGIESLKSQTVKSPSSESAPGPLSKSHSRESLVSVSRKSIGSVSKSLGKVMASPAKSTVSADTTPSPSRSVTKSSSRNSLVSLERSSAAKSPVTTGTAPSPIRPSPMRVSQPAGILADSQSRASIRSTLSRLSSQSSGSKQLKMSPLKPQRRISVTSVISENSVADLDKSNRSSPNVSADKDNHLLKMEINERPRSSLRVRSGSSCSTPGSSHRRRDGGGEKTEEAQEEQQQAEGGEAAAGEEGETQQQEEAGQGGQTEEGGETKQEDAAETQATDESQDKPQEGEEGEKTEESEDKPQEAEGEATTTEGGEESKEQPAAEGGEEQQTTEGGEEKPDAEGGEEQQTAEGGEEQQTAEGGDEQQTAEGGDEQQTTEGGDESKEEQAPAEQEAETKAEEAPQQEEDKPAADSEETPAAEADDKPAAEQQSEETPAAEEKTEDKPAEGGEEEKPAESTEAAAEPEKADAEPEKAAAEPEQGEATETKPAEEAEKPADS